MPEGRRICLKRRSHVKKDTFSCQKGAFAGRRGAISTKRAPSSAKRRICGPEWRLCWLEGRRIFPEWRRRGQITLYCIRRAPLLAGRRPYNAFGAKIDPGLSYSANGHFRPCAFGARAPVSIGEGLPAPAAPPLDPPLVSRSVKNSQSALF